METINNPLGDLYILKSIFRGFATVRLSKNQRMILEFLAIKPEMTKKKSEIFLASLLSTRQRGTLR